MPVSEMQTPMVMMVPMMETRAGHRTIRLREPLRGRAFRSNLRFAPISTAIPLASVRSAHCALRLPHNPARRADVPDTAPDIRFVLLAACDSLAWPAAPAAGIVPAWAAVATPCLAGAGFAAHRTAHRAPHSCPHQCGHSCGHSCGRFRRRLRQRASRGSLRLRPHRPPLNRRGGSPSPPSPASIIPPRSYRRFGRPDRPGRLWVSHPTQLAAGARRSRSWRALAGTSGAFGRLVLVGASV